MDIICVRTEYYKKNCFEVRISMYKVDELLDTNKLVNLLNKKKLAKKRKQKAVWIMLIIFAVVAAVVGYFWYKKCTVENFEDFEDCFDDEDFDDCFDEDIFEE